MTISSAPGRKYKILIADDNILNLELIVKYLIKNNFIVVTAKNGEEAFKKYFSESPDLIIMDVEMPGTDGCESVIKIRNSEKNNNLRIPIIALTGHYFEEDIKRIYDCGMDDYIQKPYDFRKIKERILLHLSVKN
jgi:CheY-like chemotaxis protein